MTDRQTLVQTLEHLRALVSFDTQNPPRNIDEGGLFAYVAEQLPDFRVTVDNLGDGCVSLLAVRGEPDTVYNVHMDTVPGTAHWQRDPLTLSVEDDRAYGLGACDIKGAAACLLTVASQSASPMALLLSSDEEAGSNHCIHSFLGTDHGFRRAVIAEPTQCEAVLCHRGINSWAGRFAGEAGHSSQARALTDSALHQAAHWVSAAVRWAECQQREAQFDSLQGLCFNTGTLHGGVKNNVIAPSAEVTFGFRPLPGQSPQALALEVHSLHQGPHPVQWTPRYAGPALPDADAHGGFDQALAHASALAHDLGLPIGAAVDFWTEAALFSAAGLPALVFGPGAIEQAHTADEWVSLEQLSTALGHYQRIFGAAAGTSPPAAIGGG
ncbi:MAG: acetylornithine deacetylase [Pseudomonadota bacterium]